MDYILYIISDDLVIGAIVCGIIFALIAWLSISSKTKDWDDQNTHENKNDVNKTEEKTNSLDIVNIDSLEDENICKSNSNPNKVCVYDLIPKDIVDMLWFVDGKHKNYIQNSNYDFEPSAMKEYNIINSARKADKLPYSPYYCNMTSAQKARYIQFLNNPEFKTDDLGYLFVFYYALERHLYYGSENNYNNFNKAFDFTMTLREMHDNRSFLTYSAHALILSCEDNYFLVKFYKSLDFIKTKYINIHVLLYGKVKSQYKINAMDIASHAKDFNVNIQTFLDINSVEFCELLDKEIADAYPEGICEYLGQLDDLFENDFHMYANMSLSGCKKKIPDYMNKNGFADDINLLVEGLCEKIREGKLETNSFEHLQYKWQSERLVYEYCSELFGKANVIYQCKPDFLKTQKGHMSYDIYLKEYDVAIEYQGQQHFKPIEYFGGREHFEAQKRRDILKKELSEKNGVKLIYINYNEDISKGLIIEKMMNAGINLLNISK